MSVSGRLGPQGERLALRKISTLSNELEEWRSDYEIKKARTEGGGVFDFVQGLRLAARLIYILKDRLAEHSLDANWGQIIDHEGVYLSPECDIIVHRQGGCVDRWNGESGDNPNVMDFRFIKLSHVLAVISCKSYLTSLRKKDERYCGRLKPYLGRGRKLWLFAECIKTGKEKRITDRAKNMGHNRLWYLYTWDPKNCTTREDRRLWLRFLGEIDKIGKKGAGIAS